MPVSIVDAVERMIADAKRSGAWDRWRVSPEAAKRLEAEYKATFGKTTYETTKRERDGRGGRAELRLDVPPHSTPTARSGERRR
jgi:hypothetical protein